MWSNTSSSSSSNSSSSSRNRARAASYRKVANIKGYLGGFSTLKEEEEDNDDNNNNNNNNEDASYGDMSSLGCVSTTLETSTATSETPTTRNQQHHPSVLVEIPENFPQELDHVDSNNSSSNNTPTNNNDNDVDVDEFYSCIDNTNDDEDVSVTQQRIVEMKRRWEKQQQQKQLASKNKNKKNSTAADDISAIQEIENSLSDVDTYLLSIYMNDDASIYTKATDSSFSSSGSVSSTNSTRRRHRGAYHNRRRISSSSSSSSSRNGGDKNNKTIGGNTWLDTMRESSQNFFVDNQGGWTASKGWQMQPAKKTWDNCTQPNTTTNTNDGWWNDVDPIFDSVKEERLEI